MPIIAKIEREVAVRDIESIVQEADGIMVARGDLAMSIGLEHIPETQRRLVDASRRAGKPVIVATQMLASMVHNMSATRAEVNDVANAVSQGADILMLSDETSVGEYPVEAVKFLQKAAGVAESFVTSCDCGCASSSTACADDVLMSAASMSRSRNADCIFVPAQTGATAKAISWLRPSAAIMALATSEKVMGDLSMYYGVRPVHVERYGTAERMLGIVRNVAKSMGVKRYLVVTSTSTKPGSALTLKYVEG